MADILVNALSVTNQSGLHVLAGHLEQLTKAFSVAVIARPSMTALRERTTGHVEWIDAAEGTLHWLPRARWEHRCLQGAADTCHARLYFTPSGIAATRLSILQVVLCLNPWAFVRSARHRRADVKAWLQRIAYRRTMRTAHVMAFGSHYMQQAYRANAGFEEKRGIIAYIAPEESTCRRARKWAGRHRVPGQILCVSAMAPHKNVEAVVQALHKLKTSAVSNLPPVLHLVGAWPVPSYEKQIRRLVSKLGLDDRVRFHGFLSREALDRLYAESQIYCLVSRCESFGIPAIEAQLFGTPVVCSTACAVPEICGEGGLFCDPDDIKGIAEALQQLLGSASAWKTRSDRAQTNASRYRWEECSRPLVDLFRHELSQRKSDEG